MVLAPGETLAWLLSRLQAEVWFGPEGLNIKGLIEMPVVEDQESCSAAEQNAWSSACQFTPHMRSEESMRRTTSGPQDDSPFFWWSPSSRVLK